MNTVLIIEDDPIILHIYKAQIEKAGFAVETAVNGEDGLRAIQQIDPDFVLLDLMLPKVDGVEFLKRIRGQKEFAQRPIFVFTNVYLSDLAKDAAKAGATQVFDKSVAVPQDIIRAIRDVLDSSADSSASHGDSSAQAKNGEVEPLAAEPGAPDLGSQHELVQAFVETAPETLLGLRKILQAVAKSEGRAARLTQLSNLYEKIHSLGGGAAAAGLRSLSQLSAALEALLKQLTDKPDDLTPSSLRTLSHAMDFLDVLFKHDAPSDPLETSPLKILVVDDESLSRFAIVSALKRAKLDSVDVDNPKVALQLLTESSFDLIFLDVSMPDMNGFDLCRELRKLPIHKTTPIIFVTSSADFESRSRGALSGGNDLIAKPFLFTELTVKALNYALKNRFFQPDLSVREIAVADPIKPIIPAPEVILFGDHGEVLPAEPIRSGPRQKQPAPSSPKLQPARGAAPRSVFAVIKNSVPSMPFRSNSNTAQPIPFAASEEKAEQSPYAETVDQAEAEGSRVEKKLAEHMQVQAQRSPKSDEGPHDEAPCAELVKSREALTEEPNRQKQIEDGLGEANRDLGLEPKGQKSEVDLKADANKQGRVEAPLRRTKAEPEVQPNQKRTELTQIPPNVAPPKDEAKENYEDREHALESARRKRDVLDEPSQKLLQPAHPILGIAEKLLGTSLTTEQRALVVSLQSRAESLLGLNQALVEHSRASDAKVNSKPLTFDLYSTLEEATEEFAVEAKQRKIELAVLVDQRAPLELQGDQSWLCQMLTHLIRTTLKLAKTGPVLLHVTKEEETQSSVTLRFVVRGIDLERGQTFQLDWLQAIAPGETPKVGKYEAGEVDVAVAQQLVGIMKGRFGIEFSADLSSSFWFTVQFSKAADSTQAAVVGLRVLVVDRDQMKRDLLQARLQASGLECSTVANATDAAALLRREITSGDPFKVALIGGQLGDMTGLTLAKLLKGDPALADVALVITQREIAEFSDELYRDAGIVACISEPLRQSRLFTILREIECQSRPSALRPMDKAEKAQPNT